MTHRAVAVVPAAGRSERFGSMKLLADVRGEPLLNHTLRSLIDAAVDAVTVVVSPAVILDAAGLLGHPRVRVAVNPDPSRGMFSSIQVGLDASEGRIILVLPADMPFVSSPTVDAAVSECERTGNVVVPTYQGRHGHPLIVPGRYRAGLLAASPNDTLKDALRSVAGAPHEFHVIDPGVVRDVDIPSDLSGPED